MGAREGVRASVLAGFHRSVAAAEPAGGEEDDLLPSIADCGGSREEV